ncbi:transposase [Streptococcus mitis]|uniref:transposase n=1 Tax=Streptococcus mitis TaxID=28037 RepID=UPI0039C432AE
MCIQYRHFFLPLPSYSPDLNPIEQVWAILKKKVTEEKFNHFSKDKDKTSSIVAEESLIDLVNFPLL